MRPDNWPSLLGEYIEAARSTAFAWGANDCVTFSCVWHSLMTGIDVYAPFRGKYNSEAQAFRLMIDNDVHGMEQAGRFLFGDPQAAIQTIGRGDIVYAEGALGICTGAVAAFLSEEGLIFVRHDKFDLGWSV